MIMTIEKVEFDKERAKKEMRAELDRSYIESGRRPPPALTDEDRAEIAALAATADALIAPFSQALERCHAVRG
jgi:hypothetical protein